MFNERPNTGAMRMEKHQADYRSIQRQLPRLFCIAPNQRRSHRSLCIACVGDY